MSDKVRLALAGIAGYGDHYLDALFHDPRASAIHFVAAVDPAPQRSKRLTTLQSRGITIHPTLEALFEASAIDLLIVSTPIHLHAPQTCFALERGANVLCEKPLAGSLDDAQRIADAERASGKIVAIGYQWCFSDAVQSLKRDIMAGKLGALLRMKTIVCPPRGLAYFARSRWAGRVSTDAGEAVLDSPVNNANAHYLQVMLYLLGNSRETSAAPTKIEAELYRANAIENYDTAAMRVTFDGGSEALFYTSHATSDRVGPISRLEFENAVVEFDLHGSGTFVARHRDGRVHDYGDPVADPFAKVWQTINAIRGGALPACGIAAAQSHTACVVAAQDSPLRDFRPSLRREREDDGDRFVYIQGLSQELMTCYEQGVLPAEIRLTWR